MLVVRKQPDEKQNPVAKDEPEAPVTEPYTYTIDDISFPARNNVFFVPSEPLADDELSFVVEIPKGSQMKYETRTATGQLFLDRELCPRQVLENGELGGWVHGYPSHYGFSAGLINEDGDPLDLLVFGADEKYNAMIEARTIEPQRVRVIGLIKMEECDRLLDDGMGCTDDADWVQDWKVLAVDVEGEYSDVTDIEALDPDMITALERFFSNYKGPVADASGALRNQTRVAGLMNKSDTLEHFVASFVRVDQAARAAQEAECRELFQDRLAGADSLPASPGFDPDFLGCIHDVHDRTFFESKSNFSFILNYGAYQLLYAIAKGDGKKMKGITLENAVATMQARRDNGFQDHFRFVSFDSPSPGLGTAVFEWVKTKDRNQGCPDGTPPQHYEERPLIDFEGLQFPGSE